MNKTKSIVIAGLITGAALLLSACNTPGSASTSTDASQTAAATSQATPTVSPVTSPTTGSPSTVPSDFNGSLTDLIAMGGDHQCTWSGTIANQSVTGTVYFSGKNFHSEAKTSIPQIGTMTVFAIGDSTKVTTWTSLAPTKKVTTTIDANKPVSSAGAQAFNSFAQKYDYHCQSWVADQTMFVVPQ